jgi:hypothetical protein
LVKRDLLRNEFCAPLRLLFYKSSNGLVISPRIALVSAV